MAKESARSTAIKHSKAGKTFPTGIMVYKTPKKVSLGQWAVKHPDCDSIYERKDTGSDVYIYAYAKTKKHNATLRKYRDRKLPNMVILRGLSTDGLNIIV